MRAVRLSLSTLMLAASFALALRPMANNDLWWHLETGRWILEHHRLPIEDPFSFTRFMQPWHDVEWLSELAMFGLWKLAGEAGLVLGAALVLALVFALVRALARLTTGSESLATGLMVVSVVMSRYWWAPRPTLASDVGALLVLVIIEHYRRGGAWRAIWAVPAVAALWANLHGGFILAPVLVGTVAGAAWLASVFPGLPSEGFSTRARNRLIVVALIVPAALLVNANGVSVFPQAFEMFGASKYRFLVDEWTWPDLKFVLAAWSVTAAIVIGGRRRARLSTIALGFGLTALSTSAHRFELDYGLLVLPVLGEYLIDRSALSSTLILAAPTLTLIPGMPVFVPPLIALLSLGTDRIRSIRSLSLPVWVAFKLSARQALAMIALLALLTVVAGRDRLRMNLDPYPTAAIEVLTAARAERVFNFYSWGGWILWTTDLPTFIDGRSWGGGNFGDYISARGGQYREIFRRDDVRWTLLPPDAPLNDALGSDPAWERAFADDKAVVFRRRAPAPPP